MAQEDAKRDGNYVTSMLFVGSDGFTHPAEGDETTGRLKVDSASGSGTVTSVSVVTANGISGSVANATTTPAITLTLGAITPTSVNSVVVSGASTPTLAVTGTTAVSGTNTGDQTSVSGNAGTATALQNARTIGGVSFNGTANITVATATGGFTVSGGDLALGANSITMSGSVGVTGTRVTKGWFTDVESTNMYTVGGTSLSSTFAPIASPTFTGLVTTPAIKITTGAGSGKVLTSDADGDATWETPSSGIPVVRTSVANFDIVATSSRYSITNTDAGTSTGGTAGLISQPGASSGSTTLTWQVCGGASDAELGSPLFSCSLASFTVGTDFTFFIGLGAVTTASAGLTMTDAHIGFKITRTSSGAINLVATQANGTETVSGTLTTFAANDSLDLILKVNGSSSVDYYWRKNGGALSSATNLTTNIGTGLYSAQSAISNKTVASNTVMQISSMSYTR